MAFVLPLFAPNVSFCWCLGKVVPCIYGISWVSPLLFTVCYALFDRPFGVIDRLCSVIDVNFLYLFSYQGA